MSQPVYDIYSNQSLKKRGIPLHTILTPDNHQILLEKDTLRNIANIIATKTNRKPEVSDIDQLINFIKILPPHKFNKITLNDAQHKIANWFLERYAIQDRIIDENKETSVVELTKLNEITDMPGIVEYQNKEINQFTKNENSYKYDYFSDRRGNAVVDYNKVNKNFSSPDSLPPGKKLTLEEYNKNNYETLSLVKNFLDPDSVEKLIGRISSSYLNFQSISLVHQTVPLDSRNRLVNDPNLTEYTWNIHTAGKPGSQGDIRIQDTLQQVVQMEIGQFWLPMTAPITGDYYNKVRMLVKEFLTQSNYVTEFLTSNISDPTVSYYHFEFDIVATQGNRVLLNPVNKLYTFRKPFAQVNKLTISFRTPFDQWVFPPDRGVYTITYGNPTVLTITSYPFITGISTGDLIYILNSSSGNATIDAFLTRTTGYIATKISNIQFSIPLDTSILVGSELNINVYYGSQRVFFGLNFVTLEQ